MNLDEQEQFCQMLREGRPRSLAAAELGRLPGFIEQLIQGDTDFREAVLAAEAAAVGEIEAALMAKARAGHFQAAKFVLTNLSPGKWQDRRTIAHEGETTVKINVELTQALTRSLEAGGRDDVIDIIDAVEDEELDALRPRALQAG